MVSRFDQSRVSPWIATAALLAAYAASSPAAPPTTADVRAASTASIASASSDYPTYARVQYVQECMVRSGGSEAALYKCSCAIDRIAAHLTYDEFVEASTYAQYATLAGENGGIFRDHPLAQQQAKLMRSVESAAWHACGLGAPTH
jgi:hypothetical protein